MSTPRVLVIDIDGATPELIEPWAEAGQPPALSWLMREGAWGPLQAWPSMNSAAAWTSLVTGCNPARHGIYDFGDIRPWRELRWRPVTGADRKSISPYLLSSLDSGTAFRPKLRSNRLGGAPHAKVDILSLSRICSPRFELDLLI